MPNGSSDAKNRHERRRYKRTHVLMAADLVSAQRATAGLVLDISANGAQIQFTEPLVPDSAMTLRLAETVDLGVEIAWQPQPPWSAVPGSAEPDFLDFCGAASRRGSGGNLKI